jgi:RHH-type proline utilization regulon transcriptional repressor/proline dehydrogenase/delta 1-pyrroline-5-carboxylate dehydrogenase
VAVPDPPARNIDAEVESLARRLFEQGQAHRHRLGRGGWSEPLMGWAMTHPSLKTQLFRFVDVFPATTDDADVVRHLGEYLELADAPRALDLGLAASAHFPLRRLSASLARATISRLARQFIVGATAAEAVAGLQRLWAAGSAFTVDVLGEKTVDERGARRYAERVGELLATLPAATRAWPDRPVIDHDDLGALPRVNVSVKPSALSSLLAPLTGAEGLAQAADRLRPIMGVARAEGALVQLDMERYETSSLTLALLRSVLADPQLAGLHLGLAVQAYLRDSYQGLCELLDGLAQRPGPPVTVRLVRGAYWDAERIEAQAQGWPVPVFERKVDTDANYERCVRLLHDHHGTVRAAFGTHNPRSIAYAVTYARRLGIPDDGYEIQMLYGMAEPLHQAVRDLGLRHRVYAPVGELVPGMAYLVRRLLENTSNESVVAQRFVSGRIVDELAADPAGRDPAGAAQATDAAPAAHNPAARTRTGRNRTARTPAPARVEDPGPYRREPLAEWRQAAERRRFAEAVDRVGGSGLGEEVPAVIGRRRVATDRVIESVDPASPATVVARSAACGPAEVEEAVAQAARAWPAWRRAPAPARAAVLFRAAGWMRARRRELAALEVFEVGKPWSDADADVCEAIDYCEYYGRAALRLASGSAVESPPGERNEVNYEPRGIGAVIAPWNFPLAIPTGMTAAALVTGNAVILKPAEQAPATASRLVEALRAGGLPDGVLSFLPGDGELVGGALVAHPSVAFVAFTGSKAVGEAIIERAAVPTPRRRHITHVVAEMGGKNPLVVDADADLDQAVPIAVASAFGYSGQKCSACSRLIVVGGGADELVERLVGAASQLVIGHPRLMAVSVGPLIDADAHARVQGYVAGAGTAGEVVLHRRDVPDEGWFVGPTIVTGVRHDAPLARDEIFGPVLCVLQAESLDEAIAMANASEYALTAGIVSRSPAHIAYATAELRAGNVYVNRPMTGAVVGRQPFGGHGMSGTGSKAGGADYLLEFVESRSVSENTLRQGFAATTDGSG